MRTQTRVWIETKLKGMKERIYIDSSVISVYTARASNDLIKTARKKSPNGGGIKLSQTMNA